MVSTNKLFKIFLNHTKAHLHKTHSVGLKGFTLKKVFLMDHVNNSLHSSFFVADMREVWNQK